MDEFNSARRSYWVFAAVTTATTHHHATHTRPGPGRAIVVCVLVKCTSTYEYDVCRL